MFERTEFEGFLVHVLGALGLSRPCLRFVLVSELLSLLELIENLDIGLYFSSQLKLKEE